MRYFGESKCLLELVELVEEISAVSVALLLDFFDAQIE
jgi:hypothetical protein